MLSPTQYLLNKHTPEELAKQLWEAVQLNIRLRDENLRLTTENFWLKRAPCNSPATTS